MRNLHCISQIRVFEKHRSFRTKRARLYILQITISEPRLVKKSSNSGEKGDSNDAALVCRNHASENDWLSQMVLHSKAADSFPKERPSEPALVSNEERLGGDECFVDSGRPVSSSEAGSFGAKATVVVMQHPSWSLSSRPERGGAVLTLASSPFV